MIVLIVVLFGCRNQGSTPHKTSNDAWIQKIITNSDSSYSKPYFRTDFVTAHYFINHHDSTLCQIMKDSSGQIRQVVMSKKDIRIHFSQYYQNGQLQAELPLDQFGQYHGNAVLFYENGATQSKGTYNHGLKVGKWIYFDIAGKLSAQEEFGENGQEIKVTK